MDPKDKALQRSMIPALLINLALAAAKQLTGIQTQSIWLIALSYSRTHSASMWLTPA